MLRNNGEFTTDLETFEYNVKKFKKSREKNYDFLTKAGKSFQVAVFKLCQRMIQEEVFPQSFQNTTCRVLPSGCSSSARRTREPRCQPSWRGHRLSSQSGMVRRYKDRYLWNSNAWVALTRVVRHNGTWTVWFSDLSRRRSEVTGSFLIQRVPELGSTLWYAKHLVP